MYQKYINLLFFQHVTIWFLSFFGLIKITVKKFKFSGVKDFILFERAIV